MQAVVPHFLLLLLLLGGENAASGCIMSYDGWSPLSVAERMQRAEVVLTATVHHTYRHDDNDDDGTYVAQVRVLSVIKGESVLGGGESSRTYNVSNFGSKSMCYSNILPGQSYILFLSVTADGHLTARYDDIFGAAADMTAANMDAVLRGAGLGRWWSDWSPCTTTCGGGRQERKRQCPSSPQCIEKEVRKCNIFQCRGSRDLLKIFNVGKAGRRGVRPLEDRPGAFRIDRSSHLRLPAYALFPYAEFFPAVFSLVATVRASPAGGGNFWGITDASGRRRLALRLGATVEFAILDAPAVLQRRHSGPGPPPRPSYFRWNATVADFRWHSVALAVRRSQLLLYVDCGLHSTAFVTRTHAGTDIAGVSMLTVGYLPNTIRDLNFDGDVEQLVIVPDADAAEQQCGQITKTVDSEVEALVMDESYVGVDEGSGHLVGSGDDAVPFELEWSEWSACSVSCGQGIQKRTSYCVDNGRDLEECIDSSKEKFETRSCRLQPCLPLRPGREFSQRPSLPPLPFRESSSTTTEKYLPQQKRQCLACDNGGTCLSGERCFCRAGFFGRRCQQVSCLGGCINGGRCLKPDVCSCPPGFGGSRCQEVVCVPPCENGGRCLAPGRCLCPYGFAPPACAPVCNPPCYNGGVCLAPSRCGCAKGYAGRHCQDALCRDGCKNGGRCVEPDKCICPSGFAGKDCSAPLCQPTCRNEGLCVRPFTCLCKPGFQGSSCEKFVCVPGCSNGGTCTAVNKCSCPANYVGSHCQTTVCSAKCLHGGKCVSQTKCSCPSGFFGEMCEKRNCKKYQTVSEPYQRSYKKKITRSSKDTCKSWNWKTCLKSKTEYEIVNRTFYRTSYKCVQ